MPKKVAIVYDWIDKWGGVERVLLTLHELFPHAHFFTSYFDPEEASWAKDFDIKTSFIQRLPAFIKKNRLLSFFLYPYAFESFDFSDYDLVVSVTSSFAKGIITKPGATHICYLLTPPRYLWSHATIYLDTLNYSYFLKKLRIVKSLQNYDYIAAQRPDRIISISNTVAARCRKYYKRESEVIYPPFDTAHWQSVKRETWNVKRLYAKLPEKFFLLVSRLEPYKKIALAVEACNKTRKQLVIVGTGTQEAKLRRMANDTIIFKNNLTDQELGALYARAQALIMPQEEDFGLVALEAQFFGCPVIAYKKGGAIETVVEAKNGIFFDKQTASSLISAIARFEKMTYNLRRSTKTYGPKHLEKFSKRIFENQFFTFLSKFKSQNSKLKNTS